MRTRDQEAAAQDVAHLPHRLEVRGRPASLTWPDICANCATPATERIRVRRAWYRRVRSREYGGLGYRVVSVRLPFCDACSERHRTTVPHRSWWSRYGWFVFNPAHIATIGCAVVLVMLLGSGPAGTDSSEGGRLGSRLVALLAGGMVWTIAVTWWMTRPARFEPVSDVTAAVAISDAVNQFLEGRRHLYGFRNEVFADAFARANQSRVWTERDQARSWRTSLVVTVLLIVVVGGARALLWYVEGR